MLLQCIHGHKHLRHALARSVRLQTTATAISLDKELPQQCLCTARKEHSLVPSFKQ